MPINPDDLASISERWDQVVNPPEGIGGEPTEKEGLELYGPDGPIGVVDALDVALHAWLICAHADEERLLEEYQRIEANFRVACENLDRVLEHYANTMPPEVRDPLRTLQTRMWGLL